MILVVGASGTLGTRLVRRLLERGLAVRAMSREPSRVAALAALGAEIVPGDLLDAESVRAAAAGADVVVGAAHGLLGVGRNSPASVDRLGNRHLVDAAAAAGADVVLVSIVGATKGSAVDFFRAKYDAEQYLWQSGVAATVVRATPFVETWIGILGDPLRAGGRALVFGAGRNPINFVGADAVAALVERAIVDRALRSATIEIGGPEHMTMLEFAERLSRRHGVVKTPRHVPRTALRAMSVVLRPFNAVLARQAAAALMMDTQPMTWDVGAFSARFPDFANPGVRTMLAETGLLDGSLAGP